MYIVSALEEWGSFKATYAKKYDSAEEEQARLAIYLDNKRIIEEHNVLHEAGQISWSVGMNVFGDLTETEFKAKYTGQAMPRTRSACSNHYSMGNAPESFDHRLLGAVTPVKDRGPCGSCWSFGATGSAEAQYHKSTGTLASMSEQNLLDCALNWGCNGGGRSDIGLKYIHTDGVNSESDYPYYAAQYTCSQVRNT